MTPPDPAPSPLSLSADWFVQAAAAGDGAPSRWLLALLERDMSAAEAAAAELGLDLSVVGERVAARGDAATLTRAVVVRRAGEHAAADGRAVASVADVAWAILALAAPVPGSVPAPEPEPGPAAPPAVEPEPAPAKPAPSRPARHTPADPPPAAAPAAPASASTPGPDARVVRVFVSSTFRDMGAERDELVKRTFPALRKLCESRGVIWGEVDLRWGITEEQKAEGRVLPICLAEIARSRPYFIGLLGERYGWVPDAIDPGAIETEPWLAEHAGRSVTELEILHGVLNDPDMAGHAFFYLRDPAYVEGKPAEQFRESEPGPKDLLTDLKRRICASRLPVRENYPDPRTLGELVLADLSAVIESRYPAGSEPDPLARETAEHEAFAASRAGVYIGRAAYFERLDAGASGDGAPLVVIGDSGSGKSALLANWATRYRAGHPAEFVLTHFIGASPASTDPASMVRRLIGELKSRFDLSIEIPEAPDALRLAFANSLHMAAARGRVVLVIDALNQLEDREGALDLAWLPPVIPDNVRLVVSTLPGRTLDAAARRGWSTLSIAPLEPAERESLIVDYLATYSRALGQALRARIAASPGCANPLYLRALLDELRVWGEHETLPARIDYYLAADSVAALYELILARYEADYERDSPGLVAEAFKLLWAARRGLSETELLELLGSDGSPLPRAFWSPLYLAAEQSLTSRSGLLGFFHDYLRAAVEHRYLPDEPTRCSAHLRLADYFAARELGPRKIDELPWQLAEASAWQRLADLLADLEFLEAAWAADSLEVKAAWAKVEAHSSLRLADAYRSLIADPAGGSLRLVLFAANLLRETGHLEPALALNQYLTRRHREDGDTADWAGSLGSQAIIRLALGDLDAAMSLLKEQERMCLELGHTGGLIAALGNQAIVLKTRGDFTGAMALYKQVERLCRDAGDRSGLAAALGNQAVVTRTCGDPDQAMALHEQEERIYRELGDRDGVARSIGNQATIHRLLGEYDEAFALHEREEAIFRELGSREGLAVSLVNRALVLMTRREFDRALPLLIEQESICREIGDKDGLAASLCNQGIILGSRGEIDRAMEYLQAAERLCREIGNKYRLHAALGNQAFIYKARGDLKKALETHQEVESLCRELDVPEGVATSLAGQASLLREMGRQREALAKAEEAFQVASQHGLTVLAGQTRSLLDGLRRGG
jgi:tetratricopeptide (TPR) repeat protein